LSDKQVAAAPTSATPPEYSLDLSDLANGKAASVTYVDTSGTSHTINFVRADSTATGPAVGLGSAGNTVAVDFSAGAASVQSQITSALSANGLGSSASGLTFTLSGPTSGTSGVTAFTKTVATTGTQSGDASLPLFVDGGAASSNNVYQGSAAGTPAFTGFASRITVNSAVTGNPDSLVKYDSTTLAGDTTRPAFLLSQLTSTSQNFTAAAGIGSTATGYSGSFSAFAQQVISFQASASSSATSLNDGQQTVLSGVQDRYSDKAGVNIDTELTQLIQLQTAYSANARVLTAANDLLSTLFRTVQ
jgi:flagellar hook-associated protein 1 FlgK